MNSVLPELADDAPYTSQDIDFAGTRAQMDACAIALDADVQYRKPGDATPSTGKVIYYDHSHTKREIDFLTEPFGLKRQEILALSFQITVTSTQGVVAHARILHPYHCLQSRVANTAGLPGYSTPHALRQLRASVKCMRGFLLSELADGELDTVAHYNEALFSFCRNSRHVRDVVTKHAIEPFDAVLNDPRLPESFQTKRYPQMQHEIAKKRETAQRAAERGVQVKARASRKD